MNNKPFQVFVAYRNSFYLKIAKILNLNIESFFLYYYQKNQELYHFNKFQPNQKKLSATRYNLYSFSRYVNSLPGDTAECGVLDGAGSYVIASINESSTHYCFDSFEGLSEPNLYDNNFDKESYIWKKGDLKVSLDLVKGNLKMLKNIVYLKGWIPNKFQEVSNNYFKLVHIDVDLYEPTKDSLNFFSKRMVKGGIIICNDYNYFVCPGAKKACDEFIEENNDWRLIPLSSGEALFIK